MTGKPLRLTICAVLAIIIAASVAIALRLSSVPPANNQSATPSAIATSGQLTAFLPRRAGNLQLENLQSGPLKPMVSLPECLLPPNTADGFPPATALPSSTMTSMSRLLPELIHRTITASVSSCSVIARANSRRSLGCSDRLPRAVHERSRLALEST